MRASAPADVCEVAILFGQSHNSLNGGSLEQGGIDGLMAPAPPLDAETPLDAAPRLDVDPPRDP
jgi:hypothetical protein